MNLFNESMVAIVKNGSLTPLLILPFLNGTVHFFGVGFSDSLSTEKPLDSQRRIKPLVDATGQ